MILDTIFLSIMKSTFSLEIKSAIPNPQSAFRNPKFSSALLIFSSSALLLFPPHPPRRAALPNHPTTQTLKHLNT
jgi:hypothetical protein